MTGLGKHMSIPSAQTTSVPTTFVLYCTESLLQTISIFPLQAPAHVRHISAYRHIHEFQYTVSGPRRPPSRKPSLHAPNACTKLISRIKSNLNLLVKHTVSKRLLPTSCVIDLGFDMRLKL